MPVTDHGKECHNPDDDDDDDDAPSPTGKFIQLAGING